MYPNTLGSRLVVYDLELVCVLHYTFIFYNVACNNVTQKYATITGKSIIYASYSHYGGQYRDSKWIIPEDNIKSCQ